jgi:hypothetical protein
LDDTIDKEKSQIKIKKIYGKEGEIG